MPSNKSNRFQHQPWYIKLWRFRWYLLIPFNAIKFYWHEHTRPLRPEFKADWRMTFAQCWGLATGCAQIPMNWIYDWEELKPRQSKWDDNAYKVIFRRTGDLLWVTVKSHPEWVGCGRNKEAAIKMLRQTIEFSGGIFNPRTIWLSRRIKFSKTGKL